MHDIVVNLCEYMCIFVFSLEHTCTKCSLRWFHNRMVGNSREIRGGKSSDSGRQGANLSQLVVHQGNWPGAVYPLINQHCYGESPRFQIDTVPSKRWIHFHVHSGFSVAYLEDHPISKWLITNNPHV